MHTENAATCSCAHHLVIPALIGAIGLTFFLGNLDVLSKHAVDVMWPSFLALSGLQMLFSRRCKCHGDHGHCHHCHHCNDCKSSEKPA